jgi:hypothetical protein
MAADMQRLFRVGCTDRLRSVFIQFPPNQTIKRILPRAPETIEYNCAPPQPFDSISHAYPVFTHNPNSWMIPTCKYCIKNRNAKSASRPKAWACTRVWNYCVAQQRDTELRYHAGAPKRKWASRYDPQKLCQDVGTMFGVHQQSIGGASHDRDVNAAKNILALALSARRPVEKYRRAA